MTKTVDFEPLTKASHLRDLPDEDLREAIAALLLRHPGLGMSGFDVHGDAERSLLSAQGVSQTRKALCFLSGGGVRRAASVTRMNSSGWKHLVERQTGYLCNGSFILACLLLGIAWRRER